MAEVQQTIGKFEWLSEVCRNIFILLEELVHVSRYFSIFCCIWSTWFRSWRYRKSSLPFYKCTSHGMRVWCKITHQIDHIFHSVLLYLVATNCFANVSTIVDPQILWKSQKIFDHRRTRSPGKSTTTMSITNASLSKGRLLDTHTDNPKTPSNPNYFLSTHGYQTELHTCVVVPAIIIWY